MMELSWSPDAEALERYLAGACSETEQAAIVRWCREHPARAERLSAMAYALQRPVSCEPVFDAGAFEAQVMAELRRQDTRVTVDHGALPDGARRFPERREKDAYNSWQKRQWFGREILPEHRILGKHALRGKAWLTNPDGPNHRDRRYGIESLRMRFGRRIMFGISVALVALLTVLAHRPLSLTPARITRYHTDVGERKTVRLPSGTRMTLAPATDIVLTSRGVDITGEAYFAVVPNLSQSFTVRTRNSVIRVLGTKFSVRQYPDEHLSQVVVEQGRVSLHGVRSTVAPAILSSRMVAQVSDSSVVVSSGVGTREYMGWTSGILSFNRVELRSVLAELGRAYGVEIQANDSALARIPVVLEVSVEQQSLQQVLEFVSAVADAHYAYDGHKYLFSQGRRLPPMKHQRSLQLEKQYGR